MRTSRFALSARTLAQLPVGPTLTRLLVANIMLNQTLTETVDLLTP